ncbi:hypothetical protein P7C71_g2558, partial [Lecanoromycetidae sp. Uapishka_2]
MKRKVDHDPTFNNVKFIKTEKEGDTNYSEDVKKKITASARTGQACDRCRVRKMRCDDQANGCAPCMQNNTECKTTDRITGKATVRGYVQCLEQRLQQLENHNRELQARLMSLGEDVKPSNGYTDLSTAPLLQWHENERLGTQQTWEGNGRRRDMANVDDQVNKIVLNGSSPSTSTDEQSRLPEFRTGLAGNNYLGLSTGNSLLSSIRGTAMNVLGMEIDLANYMSPDLDEPDPSTSWTRPVYNKSYRAFVQTAFGTSPKLNKVELPPRSEGLNYAELYFRLAVRTPHSAERRAEMNQSSNFHYHYALGFFGQLMASHTLADAQALTMLCLHIRNLPKPGPCWMITSITLDLAIELGLHRSARRWAPTAKRNTLEIEIRKRVFWSLLVIHVIVAGNLGRPMALRSDDWDVEMPEAIDDDLLSDNGLDTSRAGKCNFLVGLEALKVAPLYMDLYNNIYAVKRSPQNYVDTVLRLEKRISDWLEKWPVELKDESAADNELGRVHTQYLAIWGLHIRLLLRHPSLSMAQSSDFNSENLTICMDVSRRMLHHVRQLQKYSTLDGTWQNGALYILAIATTLFGHWERRQSVTSADLNALKEDMDCWLSIISDMSTLLGVLHSSLGSSVSLTIIQDRLLSEKETSLRMPSNQQSDPPTQPLPSGHTSAPHQYHPNPEFRAYAPPSDGTNAQIQTDNPPNVYPPQPTVAPPHPPLAYQNAPQYPYHMPYPTTNSTYPPSFPSVEALPATAAAANAYLNNFAPPTNQAYNAPPYTNFHAPGSPTSWRNWAGNMASNLEPGVEPEAEYMSSASALMQLGGRSEGSNGQNLQTGVEMGQTGANTGAQTWPFLQWT